MSLTDWLNEALGNVTQSASPGTMPPDMPGNPPSPPPPAPDTAPSASMTPPPAPDPPVPGAQPPGGPVPLPQPRPDIPTMATPPEPPAGGMNVATNTPVASPNPAGEPLSLAPPAPGAGALSPQDAAKAYSGYQAAGGGGPVTPFGGVAPDQQGRGGILSRALGMNPDQSNQLAAKLGAGFTAAGNSAGKSPFQALASGAGAALEGGTKEQHQNTKDAQGYLTQAIAAQKAGDEAGYKTNYMKYLQADLKNSQEKTASAAAANKNDSPTQLYLSAQRNVAADPLVKGAMEAYKSALKGGTPEEIAAAKAAYEQTASQRQAAHLAGVGLHPQTAQEIAKQPGMTQANPVDAGTAGITAQNIGQKLQPGQYYKNPADGQIYQFKGAPTKEKGSGVTPAVKPKPADPMKPSKDNRQAAGADAEDD